MKSTKTLSAALFLAVLSAGAVAAVSDQLHGFEIRRA
jgi:hypothetical protein